MGLRTRNGTCWALLALGLTLGLTIGRTAVAQDRPNLSVIVSTNGHSVLDNVLTAIAARAGLTGQLSVGYANPLAALRSFCGKQADKSRPDIVLATHRMDSALAAQCAQNGIDFAAIQLARNPLILAVRAGGALTGLTSRQIYLAIAREVPYHDEFVRNTAVRWADVDPALPPQDIRFQLPMRDEGSRSTFDTLVLEDGCRDEGPVKQIFAAQKRTLQCITTRSDRVREIPRAQAMRVLLEAPVGTIGVLTHAEMMQSKGQFVGLALNGAAPSAEAIHSGSYNFSSTFWLYVRIAANENDPDRESLAKLIAEAQSDAIAGPGGAVTELGLVALPDEVRTAQREALATAYQPYSFTTVVDWLSSTAMAGWRMFGIRSAQSAANEPTMDFTSLMDVAGYQIANIKSSIGIIPDASMTFSIAREMSDADHEYLARVLNQDAKLRPGALSAFQRRIISSIMDVQVVGGFQVSKVEIDFLPLPSVSLEVVPKDSLGQSNNNSTGSE